MQVSLRGAVPAEELAEIARGVDSFGMLVDLVRWSGARIVDVVVQDEFTHDVIVSRGPRWLVFDST